MNIANRIQIVRIHRVTSKCAFVLLNKFWKIHDIHELSGFRHIVFLTWGWLNACTVGGMRVMMFSATFNNISVISWLSVLLVEKTTDMSPTNFITLLYRVHLAKKRFELTALVVIGTNCNSNYHMITKTTASLLFNRWHFIWE